MTVSPVLASCVRDIPVPAEHSHVSDGGSGGGDGQPSMAGKQWVPFQISVVPYTFNAGE